MVIRSHQNDVSVLNMEDSKWCILSSIVNCGNRTKSRGKCTYGVCVNLILKLANEHIGSYVSAHVLLNSLNEWRKRDKV